MLSDKLNKLIDHMFINISLLVYQPGPQAHVAAAWSCSQWRHNVYINFTDSMYLLAFTHEITALNSS